ncbi:MAG: hypothetical protein ACRDB1_10725, partial [Microcoleaceae cyanobacterium]
MQISNSMISLLTLAFLSGQTALAEEQPGINNRESIPLPSDLSDSTTNDTTQTISPQANISEPEIITVASLPDQEQALLDHAMQSTWLAQVVGDTFGERNFRPVANTTNYQNQIAFRDVAPASDLGLNPTITLLNALLVVSTILPVMTMGFFWLVRRLIIRELVAEVNQRLNRLMEIEDKLKNYEQLSQKLLIELEANVKATEKSIDLINREAKLSRTAVEDIEVLKSQFLMQLQVIVSEVQATKYQVLQEINRTPNTPLTFPEPDRQVLHKQDKPTLKIVPDPPVAPPPIPNNKKEKTASSEMIADDYVKRSESLYLKGE